MKNNFLTIAVVSFLMTTTQGFGAQEGKGGDGIILPDGTVKMYDLWERQVEPSYDRGYMERKEHPFKPLKSLLPSLPFINSDDNGTDKLFYHLHALIPFHSKLAQIIVDELNTFKWVEAPQDLLPNPDTKPRVDSSGVRHIGCAHHQQKTILFSPSCGGFGSKMSDGHKAALMIHEAVYSYYKRRYPKTRDSFPIRTLVAAIIQGGTLALDDALKNSGLEDVYEEDKKLEDKMRSAIHAYECTSEAPELSLVKVGIRHPYVAFVELNSKLTRGTQEVDLSGKIHASGFDWFDVQLSLKGDYSYLSFFQFYSVNQKTEKVTYTLQFAKEYDVDSLEFPAHVQIEKETPKKIKLTCKSIPYTWEL